MKTVSMKRDDNGDEHDTDESEAHNVIEDDEYSSTNPPPWYDHYVANTFEQRIPIRKHVLANDRVAASTELPTIAVTNVRSISPKIHNFSEDLLIRQVSACLVSETWEKEKRNRMFKNELERLFQIDGLTYISCPRPSNKRGGGAAIIVNTRKFSLQNLNVYVPGKLECVWGLLRPKNVTRSVIFLLVLRISE